MGCSFIPVVLALLGWDAQQMIFGNHKDVPMRLLVPSVNERPLENYAICHLVNVSRINQRLDLISGIISFNF